MELILENTDIFDLDLYEKIDHAITNGNFDTLDGTWYKFEITFHLSLLYNEKMKEYCIKYVPIKPNDKSKREEKDFIYDYLSYVLNKVHDIMKKHNIKLDDLTIAGDNIEFENSIILTFQKSKRKIEMQETNKRGRRNKTNHIIVHSIMPSRPSINKKAFNFYEKEINRIFDHYFEITGEKVMSQILGINETDNVNILFREFVSQYAHLYKWCKEGEVDELHEKFAERADYVWNKYYAKDEINKTN